MADFILVALLCAWLFFVFSVWQVVRLLSGWRPAAAKVWRSDYTEAQQREDFWSAGMTAFTSRGWNWRDGEDQRHVEDEIVYTPHDGRERRTLVTRQVHRGWTPDSVYTVWYDAADPDRVTTNGPLHWALMAVLGIFATVVIANLFHEYGPPPLLAGWFH